MTEADKLKKLMEDTLSKEVDPQIDVKIGKAIHDAVIKTLKEDAVGDMGLVDMKKVNDGIALGIGSVMAVIYPQIGIVERTFAAINLMDTIGTIIKHVVNRK